MALCDDKLFDEVVPRLALFTDTNIKELQLLLINKKDPYPAYVFKDADQDIVTSLLNLVKDKKPRGHALTALAWTKHPDAIEQFQKWRKTPPSWESDLYVSVHRYTEDAGYEIREDGIINLYYDKCFQLVPRLSSTKETSDDEIAICNKPQKDHPCPKCGSNGTELISLKMKHLTDCKESITNNTIRFPACLNCYSILFAKNVENTWEWIVDEPSKPHSDQLSDDGWSLPPHVSDVNLPRHPWEAVDWCLADGISQLGGLPCPINDAVYPECPSCHDLMKFVGQIAIEELISGEGIFYAFICERCVITATTYDQS